VGLPSSKTPLHELFRAGEKGRFFLLVNGKRSSKRGKKKTLLLINRRRQFPLGKKKGTGQKSTLFRR